MKCTLSIFLVLIFTFQSIQSQVTDSLTAQSKQEMYDFYISKHKKQKKTGFILLGAGAAVMGVGFIIAANNDSDFDTVAGFLVVGTLSMFASIPVFAVSHSRARKAKAILGSGKVGIGTIPFNNTRYVSIGLNIDF